MSQILGKDRGVILIHKEINDRVTHLLFIKIYLSSSLLSEISIVC